ncbi:MAG TPA: thymidine kinase [Candidatus Dormibacteraeota bacterium]
MAAKGSLTVITGPMFSNKSGELLRLATVHRIAGRQVALFKHSLDDRYQGAEQISTHGGQSMEAEPVSTAVEIRLLAAGADVVAIDEAQFFDDGLVHVCAQLIDEGTTVFAAGLDRDFRGLPFGPMPGLMAISDDIMKLKAVCMKCRSLNGTMTQRLIDGRPPSRRDPQIMVGAAESYEARCRECHELSD